MWMMTQHCFSSTVKKAGEKHFQVRFRDRKSAEEWCRLADVPAKRIEFGGGTDYAYRVRNVKMRSLAKYVAAELGLIDYSNFKNQAKKMRGEVYAKALGRVWTDMLSLTPYSEKKKLWDEWDEYDRKHGLGKYRPKAKSSSTVAYSSGSHPAAKTSEDEPAYADSEWWYENFPPQDGGFKVDQLDADADFSDMEMDDLVQDVDRLFETKSVHDLTEDEWRALMEENPGGI